jgi:cytoplasmic iron level regulating protein YaaA (DUF328/UPF0246 family)
LFLKGVDMNNGKSNVLFLLICSNRKSSRLGNIYNAKTSVALSLSTDQSQELFDTRKKIFDLIKFGEISRDNIKLSDFPLNSKLILGPDINQSILNDGKNYLKAIDRYVGRFYREINSEDRKYIENFEHHVLIVSGLYGVVSANEYIQSYSLHIKDSQEIYKTWIDHDRLSRIILGYIKKWDIKYVFELMGDQNYQQLISWEMIRSNVASLLHTYSPQYAGADFLPSLGMLFKVLIYKSQEYLSSINAGDSLEIANDSVFFEKIIAPIKSHLAYRNQTEVFNEKKLFDERVSDFSGFEDRVQEPSFRKAVQPFRSSRDFEQIFLNSADKIGRMRRNLIRIQRNCISPIWLNKDRTNKYFYNSAVYLRNQGGNKLEMAKAMLEFEYLRNQVEYESKIISETSQEWFFIINKYEIATSIALKNKYVSMDQLEIVDKVLLD